jgi:hypothetical protein
VSRLDPSGADQGDAEHRLVIGRSSVPIRPRAPPHDRHSANGLSGGTSEPGLSPAARGAERHIKPVMGGMAGMAPALHAAHGPTGTVPT